MKHAAMKGCLTDTLFGELIFYCVVMCIIAHCTFLTCEQFGALYYNAQPQ